MGTMKVVRIILIYGFISICRASEELDSGQQKHTINNPLNHGNIKNTHNNLNHNYVRDTPQDIKHKRDDRSHPNKMTYEAKVSPKARPLNLRLDTVPRKLNPVPAVIKPIVKVPVPMLGRPVHNNNNKHFNTDDKGKVTPKTHVNSKDNSIKDNPMLHTVKPTVKQFFEDSDEPLPKEDSKVTEFKTPKSEIKLEKKAVIQPQFIENDDEDDDDDQNEVKPEPTAHVNKELNFIVTQNSTDEVKGHLHKDKEPVGSTNKFQKPEESYTENSTSTKEVKKHKGAELDSTHEIEKPVELRIKNSTSIEEITEFGGVFTKNETDNENKSSIKVKLGGQPRTTERIMIEPNDTSLIISNHDFEELRERSTGYTADTSNIHEHSNYNNWNYNYPYYSYEKCNYNDPNNYQYNYNYKTPYDYYNNDIYKPADTTNYQVIDIKPDNTDRIYRSWKNTEVRICKGKNPINVDFENCYRDRSDIKMPYFCESRPVIGNGYYGYQNMAYPYA